MAGAASCAGLALQDVAGPRFEELLRRYPTTPNLHYGYGTYLLHKDEGEPGGGDRAAREGDRDRPGSGLRPARDRLRAAQGRPARPRAALCGGGGASRSRPLRGPQRPRPRPLRDRPDGEGARRARGGGAPRPREPARARDPRRGLRAGRAPRGRGARARGPPKAPGGEGPDVDDLRWPGRRGGRGRRRSREEASDCALGTGRAGRSRSRCPLRARGEPGARAGAAGGAEAERLPRGHRGRAARRGRARQEGAHRARPPAGGESEVFEDGVPQETGNFRFLDSRAIGEALEDAATEGTPAIRQGPPPEPRAGGEPPPEPRDPSLRPARPRRSPHRAAGRALASWSSRTGRTSTCRCSRSARACGWSSSSRPTASRPGVPSCARPGELDTQYTSATDQLARPSARANAARDAPRGV